MRIEQARPDPEKAAKTQELHRKLRVWLSIIVWVVEYLKKEKKIIRKVSAHDDVHLIQYIACTFFGCDHRESS